MGYPLIIRLKWAETPAYRLNQKLPKIYGIDISDAALMFCKFHKLFTDIRLGTPYSIPFQNDFFDVALCMENLEHLTYDQILRSLKEMERVTKKRIIISTPIPYRCFSEDWHLAEIKRAAEDPQTLKKEEFVRMAAALHKTIILPSFMYKHGYRCLRDRIGFCKVVEQSVIYYKDLNLSDKAMNFFDEKNNADYSTDSYIEDIKKKFVPNFKEICKFLENFNIKSLPRNQTYLNMLYMQILVSALKRKKIQFSEKIPFLNDYIIFLLKKQIRYFIKFLISRIGTRKPIKSI